jgi:hypothetical protein
MSAFMSVLDSADFSTRPKRRRAVSHIVAVLIRLCNAEIAYRDRIPDNLQDSDAYAAADESVELLTDAIDALISAY